MIFQPLDGFYEWSRHTGRWMLAGYISCLLGIHKMLMKNETQSDFFEALRGPGTTTPLRGSKTDNNHARSGAAGDQSRVEAVLCIVGANTFNNEMLSTFLESRTDLPCHCVPHVELDHFCELYGSRPLVMFFDCSAMGSPKVCRQTMSGRCRQNPFCYVICFNVDANAHLERRALQFGVRGLLYAHQKIDLFLRSVPAVMEGELWYPRETLEKVLLTADVQAPALDECQTILTRREKNILRMLSLGMKNQEIARQLFISPHTVKTHIYKLYKKINVNNRFQASQWFSENG